MTDLFRMILILYGVFSAILLAPAQTEYLLKDTTNIKKGIFFWQFYVYDKFTDNTKIMGLVILYIFVTLGTIHCSILSTIIYIIYRLGKLSIKLWNFLFAK